MRRTYTASCSLYLRPRSRKNKRTESVIRELYFLDRKASSNDCQSGVTTVFVWLTGICKVELAQGKLRFYFGQRIKHHAFRIVRYDGFNSTESDHVASAAIARNLDRYLGCFLANSLDDAVVEVGITNISLEL